MAINYCVNCGARLEDGERTCPACGDPVPQAVLYANDNEHTDEASEAAVADDAIGAGQDNAACEDATSSSAGGLEENSEDTESDDTARTTKPPEATETSDNAAPPDACDSLIAEGADDGATSAPDADAADAGEDEEDFSKYADLSGFDIIGNYPNAPQPKPSPSYIGVPVPEDGQRAAYVAPAPTKRGKRAAKWIAAIAAILLVSAGLGLLANPHARELFRQQLLGQDSGDIESSTSENSSSNGVGAATSNDAVQTRSEALASVSDARATISEDEAFDILVNTYDRLQSYNDRVYSCLQTYNGAIVVADRSQREAAAGIASSLLAEIEKEQHAIDALGIGRASDLYDDYANVRRLLDDQYQRLAVIVESWEISLSYDDPYEHQDDILEPLRRDISANGTNIYLDDFDATYWNSRPRR